MDMSRIVSASTPLLFRNLNSSMRDHTAKDRRMAIAATIAAPRYCVRHISSASAPKIPCWLLM